MPFALLVALTAAGSLGTQLVTPVLLGLATAFEASQGQAVIAMALFLAGLGAGQLFYGPLSDRYGRRKVLLVGLAVFVLTSLVVCFSQNLETLLSGRLLQGLGAATGIPIARAILRDCHGPGKTAGRLGFLKAAMILVTMLAPPPGGWLEAAWG